MTPTIHPSQTVVQLPFNNRSESRRCDLREQSEGSVEQPARSNRSKGYEFAMTKPFALHFCERSQKWFL
jgi:hypothetical protein